MTLSSMLNYYNQGREEARLTRGRGLLELERSREIILRYIPKPPATIIDVGGGAGIYALWLARLNYTVHLIDLIPLHVEQAGQASAAQPDYPLASIREGNALSLHSDAATADAVLLLGPLYHLTERADRLTALREAYRVLKPGGWLFAATISRYALLMDGLMKGYMADAQYAGLVTQAMVDGQHRNPTQQPGHYFTTAFFHHPEELRAEITQAGFQLEALLAIEGPAAFMPNFEHSWDDEAVRASILSAVRHLETEPTILGATAHMMAVARK